MSIEELLPIPRRDDLPGLAAYLDDEAKVRALHGPPRCECEGGSRVNPREDDPTCNRCGKQPNYEQRVAA